MENEKTDGKSIEMSNFELISALKRVQFDLIELEKRFIEFQDKITDMFQEKLSLINKKVFELSSQKRMNLKEIQTLKALGIPTKDLLTHIGIKTDGETKEE